MADEFTREKISTGAGEVPAASGIEGFTTAVVADEANVSQGPVHRYFETKHDLLRCVLEWGWKNTREDIGKISDTDDARYRLLTSAADLITPEKQLERSILAGLTRVVDERLLTATQNPHPTPCR